MKYCENIFCSRASLALSILSIILVFLSNMITTDSFAKGGFEQQQKQQFKDTVAVTSATEQLRISKSLSDDLNIRQTQHSNGSPPATSINLDSGVEVKNTNNWITVN